MLIATKAGLQWDGGRVSRNASRARILREVEDSLRRLRTDYIDIYQVHWPDPLVTIEETAEAMLHAVRAGQNPRHRREQFFGSARWSGFAASRRCTCCSRPTICSNAESRPTFCPIAARTKLRRWDMARCAAACCPDECRRIRSFDGDDLRRTDPKFLQPRFAQYLAAVQELDRLAQERFGKRVIHLAVRWMLDQGITTALWGARHPDQLQPVDEVIGWPLDASAKAEIDRILRETITDPVGPEFMAPPARSVAA